MIPIEMYYMSVRYIILMENSKKLEEKLSIFHISDKINIKEFLIAITKGILHFIIKRSNFNDR